MGEWEKGKGGVDDILGLSNILVNNLLLNNHLQEIVGSHQKKIPHVQGQRRSPRKMVGGAKILLRLKPQTLQRHSEGSKKDFCTPATKNPTETEPEVCLSVSCGGMGQQWPASGAGALGFAVLGVA